MLLKKCRLLIFSVLVLALCVGTAGAEVFYSASDYVTSSVGLIGKSGGEYYANSNLVMNLGMDIRTFAFKDNNGKWRAMVREYNYGANDSVYVWDPSDWKTPMLNERGWASNIHDVASDGRYLYLATYESYVGQAQAPGQVVRVDMRNDYAVDRVVTRDAFSEGDKTYTPHAEAIRVIGDSIYVLFSYETNSDYVFEYKASEVVVFDNELDVIDEVKLDDGKGVYAKNSLRMVEYGGKLYISSVGGGMGTGAWGDVWEVDIDTLDAKQVLNPSEMSEFDNPVGVESIAAAPDGTIYLLFGGYDENWNYAASLYVTTASDLSAGDVGEKAPDFSAETGYSWDILYDEFDEVLWCMAGSGIELRDKAGKITRVFAPGQLGDNVASIAIIDDASIAEDDTIKPVKPTVTAKDGLSAALPTTVPSSEKASVADDLEISPDKIVADSAGHLLLSDSYALDQASIIWDNADKTVSVPIFRAVPAKSGDITAVGFEFTGEKLMASKPSDIKAMKVRGGTLDPLSFSYVSKEADYADGCFTIQRDGSIWTRDLSSRAKYVLVLFIKDNGDFDLDPADAAILDPVVIVKTATGGGGGGGSGGCNMGGAAVIALLAVGTLLRSTRRCKGKK